MSEWGILEQAVIFAAAGAIVSVAGALVWAIVASVPAVESAGDRGKAARPGSTSRLLVAASASELPGAAEWKFSDSWAANLTGLSAAIAAVAVAFGDKVEDVLTKEQAAAFAVTTAALAIVTALGPMAYEILLKDSKGTWYGLCAAAFFTLAGTFGSLGAVWKLLNTGPARAVIDDEDDERIAIVARSVHSGVKWAFWAVVIVVVVYAVRTLVRVLKWTTDPTAKGGAGIISVSCCASADDTTARVTLL